ncbi:hypothetical protein PACTADRAFT_51572 [Pachysolen tannophilus NRRL Y-2460]|uniref:Protein-serine/threonine kinase n=1 Tax=Pachysolen tannophilus NRRL Y-2460 TaxID=669874 RepID=A0A1E4TPY6_PACTA|nr:hypothetical protein PACTADRAFT_51572 [Pachysolen tannophilus NRRL Y-2460]
MTKNLSYIKILSRCPSSRGALSGHNGVNGSGIHLTRFMNNASLSLLQQEQNKSKARSPLRNSIHNYSTSSFSQGNNLYHELASSMSMETQHLIRSSLVSLINELADHTLPPISLDYLAAFNGVENIDSNKALDRMLLESSNEALQNLLILICRRIKEFRKLPFIVVLNPNISSIYKMYLESLAKLLTFIDEQKEIDNISFGGLRPLDFYSTFKITDMETNKLFCQNLSEIIDLHSNNLPILSEGFKDISEFKFYESEELFLNTHLRERILLRMICRHHILLSQQVQESSGSIESIGLIEKNLNVINLVKAVSDFVGDLSSMKYDEKVPVILDTTVTNSLKEVLKHDEFPLSKISEREVMIFPYISTHLEYILQELLKNSTRAHLENKVKDPIRISLVLCKNTGSPSILEIRIRDEGKGIPNKILSNLFKFSFTTVQDAVADKSEQDENYSVFNNGANADDGANLIAGMGYGLPLSKIYAEMFGGDLKLQTYEGIGTDVYITLKGPNFH